MKADSELTAKFSNIYISLLYAIMIKDINKVSHFLSSEMVKKFEDIINSLKERQVSQLYDELNVGEIDILKREEKDGLERITVRILSRYMNYLVDSEGEYLEGNNEYREEHENILVFEKSLNAQELSHYRCKYCGNNLDINFTGECPNCNNVYNMEDHDYQLVSLEVK